MNVRVRIYTFMLILLAVLISNCTSGARSINIEEASVRSAAEGANTAVYLRITNLDSDDAWIDVESPQARLIEHHRSIIQVDGTAKMEHQAKIALPQNETVELKAGGLHIMLFELKQTLEPGDTVNLSLYFGQHEKVEIDVPVKTP